MSRFSRRSLTKAAAGSAAAMSGARLLGAPAILAQTGDNPDLAPYEEAQID